jgi:O-methyltransferase
VEAAKALSAEAGRHTPERAAMFYGDFKGKDDHEFFKQALKRFAQIFHNVYAADNVILFDRNLAFLDDKKFAEVCERNARNDQERSLQLRLNTLVWAALEALRVPGDFVECGVWRGFCSAAIADYLDFDHVLKQFYLYDTFEGIPPQYDSEHHDAPAFHEAGLYESVIERFSRYPNVRVVRGVIPDTFVQAVPDQIAFLHLDLNSSMAEIAALEVLFDRVSPGGLVVFDDYGWSAYAAQQAAEDAFMRKRDHRILELPTGQGLLIKH